LRQRHRSKMDVTLSSVGDRRTIRQCARVRGANPHHESNADLYALDLPVELEAQESAVSPKLHSGRFKTTDKLIASPRRTLLCGADTPGNESWRGLQRQTPHNNIPCITTQMLSTAFVWHFYDGRAEMEPRIRELREDFALRKIPTASFAANALFLEIVRLAYNLVTAFQRTCLEESWQSLTLQRLRYKLFMLPGELTRPKNRPVLRLRPSPIIDGLPEKILAKVSKMRPLES